MKRGACTHRLATVGRPKDNHDAHVPNPSRNLNDKGYLMLRASLVIAVLSCGLLADIPDPVNPDPDSPRPIAAINTVFIEEMTWMEVRDALAAGTDTVIVSTGGIEQNGPYLATGKHNYVLRGVTEVIARRMGNVLVAPIVPFVPEGDFDPPTGHMKYPGTISVSEDTFRSLLTDICRSFEVHGFRRVVLIGDSGGNQAGMKAVAEQLTAAWKEQGSDTQVRYVPEFYDYAELTEWLESHGIYQQPEGYHDDFAMTAMIMSVDEEAVRTRQRIRARRFQINGINLAPIQKTIRWGEAIFEHRADRTIAGIEKAFADQAN